ncbi:hypothetical protein CLU93_3712 [Janthinobacterium sp. 35]|uniref:hypothetical protein n=1 Tax=Janthinobacterium sp. 35 TaxID=2035210 RepID=UPI000C6675DE|nr:hypothetical protein [Janthinobacterium sp. 35]PIG29404.1 hypothetical protein CLU93_3712 [Janthinobacterium sp. 35]
MSAVKVMRALLQANSAVVALVPLERVDAGTVPQESELPAIGIREIGRNEFATVARAEKRVLVRSRVQVTVYAKSYPEQKAVLLAAKLGPGVHTGVVAGVTVRSVVRGEVGPDLSEEDAGIFEQSRDFIVSYIEPT